MTADPTKCLALLVVANDPGVCSSIETFLTDEYEHVDIGYTGNLSEATRKLTKPARYDILLVDTPLQKTGEEQLFTWIMNQVNTTPVILLTDDKNSAFITESSSMGYSLDYLPKHRMDPFLLNRSIKYSLERTQFRRCLSDSEKQYRELFVINPVPMFIYDMETYRFLDVNEAAIKTYGYSKEEFLTLTIKEIRPGKELPKLEKILQEQTVSDELSYRGIFTHTSKNGDLIQMEIQSKFTNLHGKKVKLVLANNVTERLKTQDALRLSEQRFKSLVQDGSDLISIVDERAIYQYVSPTSTSVLGIPPETFAGTSAIHYIHHDDRARLIEELAELPQKKHIRLTPFRHLDNKNNWRWMDSTITYMLNDPAVRGIVTNSRDITEKVEQELKLKESVGRYDIISKATSDIIWDLDISKNIVIYNEAIRDVFGYEETVVDNALEWWKSKIHPDDLPSVLDKLGEVLKGGINRFQFEYRFLCANGTYKYIYDRASVVTDENGKLIRMIGAMQDITEPLKKEKELQRVNDQLKIAQEIAKMGYWTADLSDDSGEWSEELCKIYGVDPKTFIPNLQNWMKTIHPEDREKVKEHYQKLLNDRSYYDFDHRIIKPNGQVKWLLQRVTLHRDDDGTPKSIEGITQDITERKLQEAEVLASLKEKETLLSEIHHRVKNNLAVVSSLIQLQAFKEKNPELGIKLLDSVSRIKTMAIIHEQLYQSNSFANLEFCQNLKKLVLSLTETLQTETHITHSFNCNPVRLNIKQAIPCALIVNEVITNILKHAFKGRKNGEISIILSMESTRLTLKINDNGKGMPQNINPDSGKTLGLHLIDTLARQLEANYRFVSPDGRGTSFILTFEKS